MNIEKISTITHENGNEISLIQDENLNYGIEEIDPDGQTHICWDSDDPILFNELAIRFIEVINA